MQSAVGICMRILRCMRAEIGSRLGKGRGFLSHLWWGKVVGEEQEVKEKISVEMGAGLSTCELNGLGHLLIHSLYGQSRRLVIPWASPSLHRS